MDIVIVGASLTGANAAAQLRKNGFDGRVVLIGEETERPYERPTLSKESLRGEPPHRLYIHEPTFYKDKAIDLRLGARATGLDLRGRSVILDGGERVPFDRLLIATGASAKRLPIPGADLPGVNVLRTIADAEAIRDAASRAGRIVVIGGGWIGAEVAASLRMVGYDVAMLMPHAVPLERPLGPEVGAIYRDLHAANGVTLYPDQSAVQLVGRDRFEAVLTADGTRIEGDMAVFGVGADPRVELAVWAGLAMDQGGIAVDENLRSSAEGVYAAGDVAAAWHPVFGTRLRVEHWDNARRQGRTAAGNMVGPVTPYTRVPYFYSDQFDVNMEYAGHAVTWDRVVFRGEPATRSFLAFWIKDGVVVAGLNSNVADINPAISKLVGARQRVDIGRLTDPAVPLDDVAAAA